MELRDIEILRNSSIAYASALEKIRVIYPHDAELAGQFAIAYLEQLLTDENSFDDNWVIQSNMTELIKTSEKTNERYAAKLEKTMNTNYELAVKIAGYLKQGMKQKDIAAKLGKSNSWISGKIKSLKETYPDVFIKEEEKDEDLNGGFKF